MKKLILPFFTGLVFFQLVCINKAKSQEIEKPFKKLYLEAPAGVTTNGGTFWGFGLQGILKNNWVATVSYQQLDIEPKSLPADYEEGYVMIIIIPIYDGIPKAKTNIINFTGGKSFSSGRKTWFSTEAGISIIGSEELTFTKQAVEGFPLVSQSSNYSVSRQKKTTIGGVLKADFNWAFSPYVGLGAGAFVNFNSMQTPVGGHIKMIFGFLNTKKKG